MKCWLVLIRNANIQNFECILRGLKVAFRNDRCFQMSLSLYIRDMFHVYLNIFEFHFLRLHIIKTNKFCFFMHNRRVPGIAKQTRWEFIA